MHSLINCIGNAINLGCVSKHLIKYLKPWLIKRGCTNHLNFLLFDFILILHFAPLLSTCFQLGCTLKICAFSCFVKSFQFVFSKRLPIVLPKVLFTNIYINWNCAFVHNLPAFFWSPRCLGTILIGMKQKASP